MRRVNRLKRKRRKPLAPPKPPEVRIAEYRQRTWILEWRNWMRLWLSLRKLKMRAIVTVLRSFLISLVMVTEELVCFLVVGVVKYLMLLLSSYSPRRLSHDYDVPVIRKLLLCCYLRW